jgi:hypothetical protein
MYSTALAKLKINVESEMESLSDLPCTTVQRYQVRTSSRSVCGFQLLVGCVASFAASATCASEPPRFQLVGSGTLRLEQPVQKSGNVQLNAYLSPSDAERASSPVAQLGGGFALIANLAASSLVCYNDTIFRDDFDGDGF